MKEPKPVSLYWLLAAAFVFSIILFDWSYAHEGHGHNHDEGGDNVLTGGDLTGGDNTASNVASIAGSRSYGVSGSDMDIGQCVYHVGGLTVAVGLRNKFCEGMEMIRSGMVDAGVLHICKQTKIGRNYTSLKDCQDGMVMYVQGQPEHTQDDSSISEQSQDDENERIEALYARMTAYEERTVKAEAEAEKAAQRPVPQPQTIIQQQEFINESKRAKLAALKGEK